MSERTDAPTEGEPSGEPGSFPGPDDPESPEFVPGEKTPDEDGPSDDDATGADDAGDGNGDEANGDADATPPPTPDTEARLDALAKDLGRAGRSYSRKVTSLLADDDFGLVPCPLCSDHFPGLLTPAPPSAEAVAAARVIIGLPDLSNYQQDNHARECDVCAGLGKTLTGSRVPEFATIRCHECDGTGFRSALDAHKTQLHPNGSTFTPLPTHEDDLPVPAMSAESVEALERMAAAGRAALARL